jgi:hypothetical protein
MVHAFPMAAFLRMGQRNATFLGLHLSCIRPPSWCFRLSSNLSQEAGHSSTPSYCGQEKFLILTNPISKHILAASYVRTNIPIQQHHGTAEMRSLGNEVSIRQIIPLIFLPILLLVIEPAILAENFWKEKSYKDWSEAECREILQNSPWARDYTMKDVVIMGSSDRTLSDGGQPYSKYRVQFRSALPVRQAIIRMAQIDQKYDDLKPELKQQFDRQSESFLAQDLSQVVIVYITYETNQPTLYLNWSQEWKSRTTESLKNNVYLYGSKGDKVPLERFVPPQGAQRSFQLIFPRRYQGKEILGPEDTSLNLAFPIFMEFKTDKMQFNGKVEY